MSNFFPNFRPRGAETVLHGPAPTGRSMLDDVARQVGLGTGRPLPPAPPLARHSANVGVDVGSLTMPDEPELVWLTEPEKKIGDLLGASYNTAAVGAFRATQIAGPLAVDADLDDAITFGARRRPTAEWGLCDVAVDRLNADATKLEAEAVSAPSWAVDSLQRAAVELRARVAKIEALAPGVFALRLARKKYERAIRAERIAAAETSEAQIKAAAITAGPTEALRLAKIEAENILAAPSRAHADAIAALDAAKEALKSAQERV